MENFWSLLKRGLHGACISVEPFQLFLYIDELAHRFNKRKTAGADGSTWREGLSFCEDGNTRLSTI